MSRRKKIWNCLPVKKSSPYTYMDSFTKFKEKSLSPQETFFNDLSKESTSDEEYTFAKYLWEKMSCQSLQDYHDVYLLQDILLLADVFERFRSVCLETYGLDPAHYYTVCRIGLGCLSEAEKSRVTNSLTDKDQHMFLESGIRGGISSITHRYAKANNTYLEDYNPEQPSSHIIYLNENNLYGWAMSQPLPVDDFQWVENVEDFDVTWVPDDAKTE